MRLLRSRIDSFIIMTLKLYTHSTLTTRVALQCILDAVSYSIYLEIYMAIIFVKIGNIPLCRWIITKKSVKKQRFKRRWKYQYLEILSL